MIVALTGAGISKESGIPTFQDRDDIWDKLQRTYAIFYPEKYIEVMRDFVNLVADKKPNDAHIALAEYNVPVLTMNIDALHEQAGTKTLIKMHGRLPTEEELPYCNKLYNIPVLDGDVSPAYKEAYDMLDYMVAGDILLVIGASHSTSISDMLRIYAMLKGIEVVEIQDSASTKVREFLEANQDNLMDFEERKAIIDSAKETV